MPLVIDGTQGSPPPTRGAREDPAAGDDERRITPAYAGSTSSSGPTIRTSRDHPRLRGEHATGCLREATRRGSPPPTRGAPERREAGARRGGITPAYAGSTPGCCAEAAMIWDHPRLRGEHVPGACLIGTPPGSPPPTRGARPAPHRRRARARITPAYAGSTSASSTSTRSTADHPRLRGEHLLDRLLDALAEGSPPPTRGARHPLRAREDRRRITPAYAGSTWPTVSAAARPRDHPRLRGEHSSGPTGPGPLAGSPPPTRGALRVDPQRGHRRGITPAYAGSTARRP